jgi:hypothetical protein
MRCTLPVANNHDDDNQHVLDHARHPVSAPGSAELPLGSDGIDGHGPRPAIGRHDRGKEGLDIGSGDSRRQRRLKGRLAAELLIFFGGAVAGRRHHVTGRVHCSVVACAIDAVFMATCSRREGHHQVPQ